MSAEPGDKVKITTAEETVEGILMPNEQTDSVVIKLKSGYNMGIDSKKVRKIEIIAKKKPSKEGKKQKVPVNKDLPTVSILHTGGTIASKIDYASGGVVAKFTPEDLLQAVPELMNIANINCRLVSNIMSESMRFGHYNLIAKAIKEEIEKNNPKGIIISHGTDTMHYTCAALSFILENISIPVVLVGAQRSSDRGSRDGDMNLICAAKFIAEKPFPGVFVCMHNSTNDDKCAILPGTKTRKMHTSRRDAFKAVNDTPVALVDYKNNKIEVLKEPTKPEGKLTLKPLKEVRVGILRSHSNLFPEDIAYYTNFDGLIMEGTGLGHMPAKSFDKDSDINEKNKAEIAKLCKKMPVILTSQCIFGRINMNVYTPQRELLDIGVIPGEDMTTETAFIKLAWLLSNKKDQAKELMTKNLRGEISECTNPKEFLD